MVKLHTNKICGAVGDGGNDVTMIMEAHAGIGIEGVEGK
jgi:P-type E1-E2 ATPase